MDDLAGLDWSKSTAKKPQNPSYSYNASAFATLKPTPPTSGQVTPLNPSSQPPSKPATPANDSFSNLISFSNSNSTANLSLQEQQKRLADLRLQQQKKQILSLQESFPGGDESFWNTFGSGRSTPAIESQKNGRPAPRPAVEDEDNIFAAFSASTTSTTKSQEAPKSLAQIADDDDDPFELSKFQARKAEKMAFSTNGFDEDDVLGLLGQPASSRPKAEPAQEPPPRQPRDVNPQDRAVAELVDMGFPADRARQALETTDSGTDVQAAAGWLLNQAHQEAHERSHGREIGSNGHSPTSSDRRRGGGRADSSGQEWQDHQTEDSRRRQKISGAVTEKDPTQLAAEFGNNFLKTANSLWKVGQKKVQQAVQEFNSDSESSQPKWMRDPDRMAKTEARQQQRVDESGTARRRRRSSAAQSKAQQSATDEAMMLEGQRPTPPPRQYPRSRPEAQFDSSADNSRDHSPAFPSRLREAHSPQPAFLRQQQQPQKSSPQPTTASSRAALSRQANEDQAAQAYVSSARRRKAPTHAPVAASEPDLLEGSSKQQQLPPRPASSKPAPFPQPTPVAIRPPVPKRNIPSISAMSLKASHSHREKGNEHFKRGDYSSAHQAYSTSLSHLPSTYPLTIVLLTNRALTALKTGEPKIAVTDSDSAISIIGVSKGETETIDFADGSAARPMRDYYGKALMRKAEALEQLEKWNDAAAVWREAVEGGHGGATSTQGRLRSEKAASPSPSKPKSNAPPSKKAPPRPSTLFSSKAQQDSAAVSALRAANAAADRADDEKFALSDAVDARVKTWKNGKQDNLRALLGSLDTVLWEGSGWKKISMADLVLPGRVKVQYMKGIGRVHPDKIPTDATTEQRMISSAVFSTLNEAWDKFRKENAL